MNSVFKFFVIGGQKCGTSSVWNYLKGHPQIFPPKWKESFLFCSNEGKQHCLHSNTTESAKEELTKRYWKYWGPWMELDFNSESNLITGDFSTTHLTCACCHQSIKLLNPDAKIIAILRDPVKRTESRYHEQAFFKGEIWVEEVMQRNIDSFQNLVSRDSMMIAECLLRAGNYYSEKAINCIRDFNIVGWSMYDLVLPHLYSTFPPSNILITYTEDLLRNSTAEILKMESFLGIDEWVPENIHTAYNVQGKYGWKVASDSRSGRKRDASDYTDDKLQIVKEEYGGDWGAGDQQITRIDQLVSDENTHLSIQIFDPLQSREQSISSSERRGLCKALERTYRTMTEFARRGWIPPIPPEWSCR